MILVEQEQARDLHQRTSCSVSSFQVPHVPQCWFVIQFHREKMKKMQHNTTNVQIHDIEFCWSTYFCFHMMSSILHRCGNKDVEWVHEKYDWRRVWEERGEKLQLFLHMTKTSNFKRLFPPWKEKILSQFLFQMSKHCKNCECCSVSTFALCMS